MKLALQSVKFSLVFLSLGLGSVSFAGVPFFKAYPPLKDTIPYTPLGDFPTPLESCKELSEHLGCMLLCKRDDQSGALQKDATRLYGGNKVRKLEFVLAEAQRKGADAVLTFGSAGSNHALATAVYAQQLGMSTRCLLAPQPNSWVVQRNLLLQLVYKAELQAFATRKERNELTEQYKNELCLKTGSEPYVIPTGASVPLGAVGFINAVYELQEQLTAQNIPFPDSIYVPAGSFGTVAGLLIGLQLLKASTKVVAVAIEPEDILPPLHTLFDQTREFLISHDSAFADLSWDAQQLEINDACCGTGYGSPTIEAQSALQLFGDLAGITLDDTYTAKAAAALVHDAQIGKLQNKTVLFWLTFYGESCKELCDQVSYKDLPPAFQVYFH